MPHDIRDSSGSPDDSGPCAGTDGRRADAARTEPLRPRGTPLSSSQLLALAKIDPQDISQALDRFSRSVPRRFQRLLD